MKTIQYMGSKRNLLEFIDNSLNDYLIKNNIKAESFFDAFTGSGRVAYHFRNKFNLFTADKQFFSKVINDAYLKNNRDNHFYKKYIDELNNLPNDYFLNTDGWFTKNYSTDFNEGSAIGEDGNQKIWQTKNAKKIDSIRHKIDTYKELNDIEKNVLLLSLVLGINKVSNILGHQNGYLKKWCQNSSRNLILECPELDILELKHENYVGDIFDIIENVKADINYFDPPYGTNNTNLVVATRYSSFYHLWNTIVLNDRPILFGKAGKPIHTKGFTEPLEKNIKDIVIPQFKKLINLSNSKVVCFSYSNKSLINKEDFINLMKDCGCKNIEVYEKDHKENNQNLLAKKEGEFVQRENDKEQLIEYLFIGTK